MNSVLTPLIDARELPSQELSPTSGGPCDELIDLPANRLLLSVGTSDHHTSMVDPQTDRAKRRTNER